MRALVTGGRGFIGGHLSERLLADGWEVEVVDDLSARPAPVDLTRAVVRITSVNRALIPDKRPDVIFHLAAIVGPVAVLSMAGKILPATVADAEIVAHWAQEFRCPLIDVSTSEMYGGGNDGRCEENQPRIIKAGTSARMEYTVGKLAAETMLLNTPGLDVRIVRPFNVAGPRQLAYGGFVVPRFVDQALGGLPITVFQPGTQTRSLTHVLDIVDGLILLAEKGTAGSVFNLGNPHTFGSIRQLAEEVREMTGSSSPIEVVDPTTIWPQFVEAPDKLPDSSKAFRELGWEPWRSRLDIIRDVIADRLAAQAAVAPAT